VTSESNYESSEGDICQILWERLFFFFFEFIKILFIFEIPNINYLNTISIAKVFGLQVNTRGSSPGSCDLDSS
jgi:hypothetical protein